MPLRSPTLHLRARGPLACFTRPELKVERVSYPVMTPSAARGLLEAVIVIGFSERYWLAAFSTRARSSEATLNFDCPNPNVGKLCERKIKTMREQAISLPGARAPRPH